MRNLLLCLTLIASCAFAAAPKKKEGPEVLVVADLFGENPAPARPTKEKPIYFIILGGVERTIGDAIAGEPMPKKEAVGQAIATALASQGYVQTKIGGPIPSIAILFSYGSANLSTLEVNDTDPSSGETTTSVIGFNNREIAALVGADKASRKLLMSSEADRINEAARDDRVYIFVAALDVEDLRKKKKTMVWRTRISIESRRRALPEELKVMLASAAPYFGTNTDLPAFIEDADRRKAEVIIGTPTVVEDQPPAAAPKASPKK